MSAPQFIDLWPTKAQAAQRLGVAEKTIDRMIKRGDLRSRQQKLPKRPPFVGISPEDLDRLAPGVEGRVEGHQEIPVVEPVLPPVEPMSTEPARMFDTEPDALSRLMRADMSIVPVRKPRPATVPLHVPVHLKHRVTGPEAAALGYSLKLLTEEVKAGRLTRIHGRYRMRDLEAL